MSIYYEPGRGWEYSLGYNIETQEYNIIATIVSTIPSACSNTAATMLVHAEMMVHTQSEGHIQPSALVDKTSDLLQD